MTHHESTPAAADGAASEADFGGFDHLVESLARWSGSLPQWPPAGRVQAEWQAIEPRLDRARRELSRVLVVGVIGGTGTGKSTLVNALAGRVVTDAGDVARPTTTSPIVVAAPDVDLSWLPVEAMGARVVRSDAPAVANIVLVDCPDPDTQAEPDAAASQTAMVRPSDTNRNRDLLEAVLPACDVLLLVATAQKYRSWIVAREVAAFAPGRPLFFVQTHAARDPDIRGDWQRELESQGFSVPRIFRLDGVEAARRAAAGLEPEPGFRDLVAAIDEELVGRAARRVRRTGAVDLTAWFAQQCRGQLEPLRGPVEQLAAGVRAEQSRLEGLLAAAISAQLRGQRHGWQRLVTDEIVQRWHGGPFATFLHAVSALAALWQRVRPAPGVIGRLVTGGSAAVTTHDTAGWQSVAELGLSEAEVEQSRTVLTGLATRSRIGEPLVGRARVEAARVQPLAAAVLDRTGQWLGGSIGRLVADRRGRVAGPLVHWTFELLFTGLFVAVLARAGWSFFYGHLWLGRPVSGTGFLQEALVWLILWGLCLRWGVFALVRRGLDRDIAAVVADVPAARLVDPLLADFSEAAGQVTEFLDGGDRLAAEAERMATALGEPGGGLGRLWAISDRTRVS
jgi:energy-coupling factor transporter ATP-binding protein EcfA2